MAQQSLKSIPHHFLIHQSSAICSHSSSPNNLISSRSLHVPISDTVQPLMRDPTPPPKPLFSEIFPCPFPMEMNPWPSTTPLLRPHVDQLLGMSQKITFYMIIRVVSQDHLLPNYQGGLTRPPFAWLLGWSQKTTFCLIIRVVSKSRPPFAWSLGGLKRHLFGWLSGWCWKTMFSLIIRVVIKERLHCYKDTEGKTTTFFVALLSRGSCAICRSISRTCCCRL